MKKIFLSILALSSVITLVSCNNANSTTTINTTNITTTQQNSIDDGQYITKDVNIYREAGKVDKTIPIRFYKDSLHVPFISVSSYYQEFFDSQLTLTQNNGVYKYSNSNGGYMKFNTEEDLFTIYNFSSFSAHPAFKSSNYKNYSFELKTKETPMSEKVISLSNYGIDIYGDVDAYVPLNLLSLVSGGMAHYNIAYNGKDIYVLDEMAQLSKEPRSFSYYGDDYFSEINDLETPRYKDMADYSYGLLCLQFDNFRGYTSQLCFGDNNLVTLGLNGLLENYCPKVKEYLLSTDKEKYYEGYVSLMSGLYDGGHTASSMLTVPVINNAFKKAMVNADIESIANLMKDPLIGSINNKTILMNAKKKILEEYVTSEGDLNFIYKYDASTKLSFISFDSFTTDFDAWNKYYTTGMNREDIPESTDTYAFIRKSMYQALEDGAETVIIDLSTNGGGNVLALCGIVGLLNKGVVDYSVMNTLDKYKVSASYGIDINLDGKFDSLDEAEAAKFNYSIGVLTSHNSFSCGNLLPSMLKELGYKIIGQKSGGGSCNVALASTADGLVCSYSGSNCLTNSKGDNIDSGVPLDYIIAPENITDLSQVDASNMYNFALIDEYFDKLRNQ